MNKLTIEELIGELEELKAEGHETVEVHFQPNYPLKALIANVRMLDGVPVIALGPGTEYGEKKAWQDPEDDDDCCDFCGKQADLDSLSEEFIDDYGVLCEKCQEELTDEIGDEIRPMTIKGYND